MTIVLCIISFLLGSAALYFILRIGITISNKKNNISVTAEKKTAGTMDIILIVIGVVTLIFTITMIWIFIVYGAIPDTLVTCFFGFVSGECGIMGWIQNTKKKCDKSDEKNKEAKG